MLTSFHITPNFLCVKLSHRLVLTGWWAHPNCNLALNCVGSSMRFLRQKLQDKKCIFSLGLAKDSYASFIRMDGVLLEVRNRKKECCTWSLIATTSRILALKLTALVRLMIRSLSSFVSDPCLTFLSSACISCTPNQVYSLVRICHWSALLWIRKCLPTTVLLYWCSCIS
jgi:hypothetical protein